MIAPDDVLDHIVIRMPKTYPAYFGTYDRFAEIRKYLTQLRNLYPLGRNGMHRYNNQDHSMLTAMTAVDGILSGTDVREALWNINAEQDYHETRQE
jgi:protoporphyrinogen oxidase